MRIQVGVLVVALIVGLVVGLGLSLLADLKGFFLLGPLPVLPVTLGLVFCLGTLMTQNAVNIRELVKQIAVWLGIVVLVPLVVWYGTSAFHPPPDWKQYSRSTARLEERIKETKEKSEKENLRREKDRLEKEQDEAEREYYGTMFWVAYPVGLVAIVLGLFFPVQTVGTGLMFGGLASLTAGCYSYWDKMDGWLRFGSLLLALLVLLVLGTWRFWPARANGTSIPPSP